MLPTTTLQKRLQVNTHEIWTVQVLNWYRRSAAETSTPRLSWDAPTPRSIFTSMTLSDVADENLISTTTKEELPAILASRQLNNVFYFNGKKVSYAESGDLKGRPVIYIGGSGQPRITIIGFDAMAKHYGLRLIFLDRPGRGATTLDETTPLGSRVKWTTDATKDLITRHLGIEKGKCAVMTVSAGSIYAIDLIRKTDLIDTSLPIVMLSPWIPSHISGGLSIIRMTPTNVIANLHKFVQSDFSQGLGTVFSFSSGTYKSTKSLLGVKEKEKDAKKRAAFDGAYTSSEVWKYCMAEDMSAMGQDFLTCLGKTNEVRASWDCDWESLSKDQRVGATKWVMYWGVDDFMVPKKGIDWVRKNLSFVEVVEVDDAGHEDTTFRLWVAKDACSRISDKAEA